MAMANGAIMNPPGFMPKERENERKKSPFEDWAKKKLLGKGALPIPVPSPALGVGIGIGIALFVFIFIFILKGANFDTGSSTAPGDIPATGGGKSAFPPIPGFSLSLDGPEAVGNGEELKYTVNASHDPSIGNIPIENITIYLEIPTNASFIHADGNFTQNGNIISWALSDPTNQKTITFTLLPNSRDTYVNVKAYAKASAASGGTPPSADNCGGKYNLASTPLGTNFGDPVCNFTKDELYALLKQSDPVNADLWYYQVVPCESGYSPLAYNGASASGSGAYGLYQMNPSGRGYHEYDAGDVAWQTQTTNAINYSKLIPSLGAYWACAR